MSMYDEHIRLFLGRLIDKKDLLREELFVKSSVKDHAGNNVLETRIVPPEWFRLPSREYAIARGREYMVECSFRNGRAQVFTPSPITESVSLEKILNLDLTSIRNRTLFYCGLNAVLRYLGLIDKTIHCRGDKPVKCAVKMINNLSRRGFESMLVIGYQPAIIREAVKHFDKVYVTDMDRENIGRVVNGVEIMDHIYNDELIGRVDLVLATGSSVVNSTFWRIYERVGEAGNKLILYGVSGAGVAYVMGVERMCFYGE